MSPLGRALADGDRLEIAGAVIRLKVHPRARRISLRLDRSRREVVATAPNPRRLAEALAFARSRLDWIEARLAELPAPVALLPGERLHLLGEPVILQQGKGRPRLETGEDGARLIAPGEGEAYARAVLRGLKRLALDEMRALTAPHAAAFGAPAPDVRLTDTRSRWGSCKPAMGAQPAVIRYSWRLILAPRPVADYVAAHEAAHLRELNHGPRFWRLVAERVGDPTPHRAWLRAHGAGLHAVGAGLIA
ncbi:M48 family metallopeptidase [Phenylobacterium sp.]|uniref:M48 family metallopeptidase n=1 Tax=Phenylobacterium sp. TaxID=1871053 RepID=UPI002FDB619F